MNHAELVSAVALHAGTTKKDAGKVLAAVAIVMQSTMQKGGAVVIANVGVFRVQKRPSRMGVNPRTQEPIRIRAKNIPKLNSAKAFKKALN